MKDPLFIQNRISIRATREAVWNALVNPVWTKQYMYGCVPVTDWQPGSTLFWDGEYEGKPMRFVTGRLVEIIPGETLVYTVFDPNNPAIEDIPENYLTVTYHLREHDGMTAFTVTQGDYNQVADGEKRYHDAKAQGGWSAILEAIKNLVEAT